MFWSVCPHTLTFVTGVVNLCVSVVTILGVGSKKKTLFIRSSSSLRSMEKQMECLEPEIKSEQDPK